MPTLAPQQLNQIKDSWDRITPYAHSAGELFYQKLFELDPQLKQLFPRSEPHHHGQLFFDTLAIIVGFLDNPEKLRNCLQPLALRHLRYGVSTSNYDSIGAALLWTLGATLGEEFKGPLAQAWATGYGYIAQIMIDSSRPLRQVM